MIPNVESDNSLSRQGGRGSGRGWVGRGGRTQTHNPPPPLGRLPLSLTLSPQAGRGE
jgi:hypothetical protein